MLIHGHAFGKDTQNLPKSQNFISFCVLIGIWILMCRSFQAALGASTEGTPLTLTLTLIVHKLTHCTIQRWEHKRHRMCVIFPYSAFFIPSSLIPCSLIPYSEECLKPLVVQKLNRAYYQGHAAWLGPITPANPVTETTAGAGGWGGAVEFPVESIHTDSLGRGRVTMGPLKKTDWWRGKNQKKSSESSAPTVRQHGSITRWSLARRATNGPITNDIGLKRLGCSESDPQSSKWGKKAAQTCKSGLSRPKKGPNNTESAWLG